VPELVASEQQQRSAATHHPIHPHPLTKRQAAPGSGPSRPPASPPAPPQRPIELSRALAAARAAESARPDSLFLDPFAALLAEGAGGAAAAADESQAAANVVATRYIDECLLNAINQVNINSINQGERGVPAVFSPAGLRFAVPGALTSV